MAEAFFATSVATFKFTMWPRSDGGWWFVIVPVTVPERYDALFHKNFRRVRGWFRSSHDFADRAPECVCADLLPHLKLRGMTSFVQRELRELVQLQKLEGEGDG